MKRTILIAGSVTILLAAIVFAFLLWARIIEFNAYLREASAASPVCRSNIVQSGFSSLGPKSSAQLASGMRNHVAQQFLATEYGQDFFKTSEINRQLHLYFMNEWLHLDLKKLQAASCAIRSGGRFGSNFPELARTVGVDLDRASPKQSNALIRVYITFLRVSFDSLQARRLFAKYEKSSTPDGIQLDPYN